MKIYETSNRKAKDQFSDILENEYRIYEENAFNDLNVSTIRLSSTIDDFFLFLYEKTYIRPAFFVDKVNILIPCFFTVIYGYVDDFLTNVKNYVLNNDKTSILQINYDAISYYNKNIVKGLSDNIFDGKYLKEEAIFYDKIGYLDINKRKNYIAAINRVIKNDIIYNKTSNYKLLSEIFLEQNEQIVDMYHNFDYTKTSPKYFMNILHKNKPSLIAIYRMLLMYELGFDVIIISENSYDYLDNFLPKNYFDKHFLKMSNTENKNDRNFEKKFFKDSKNIIKNINLKNFFMIIFFVVVFCMIFSKFRLLNFYINFISILMTFIFLFVSLKIFILFVKIFLNILRSFFETFSELFK